MRLIYILKRITAGGMLVLIVGSALGEVLAQRPFRNFDPFYRGETAQRAFFDGYAVTAELSYRAANAIQGHTPSSEGALTAPNTFVFSFRIDYEIAPQVDLSAIMDGGGGIDGRTVKLSWLALKHYWYADGADYAIRFAVDPFSEGGLGFRQTDLAFLSTTPLTPDVTTNFAVGWRRVRVGLEQLVGNESPAASKMPPSKWEGPGIVYMRAAGHEIHLMTSYHFIVDPAESHIFVSFLGEAGEYDVVETPVFARSPSDVEQHGERVRGGVVWLWSGFQWNRPSYQVAPYLSVPLVRWSQSMAKSHVGLRFTVR